MLKNTRAQSTKDYICEAIKDGIAKGNFLPGQELGQEALAKYFGVSRMPVREALQILAVEGYVEVLDNRHMQIANPKNKIKNNTKLKKSFPVGKKAVLISDASTTVGDNSFHKIQLLPAREQVAAVLRKEILSQQLTAGREISLKEIADYVGMSITPVREAFQILASDGLLALRPNKGAVVLGVNKKFIQDHYETRAILESEAAAKAAQPDADISEIENVYKRVCKSLKAKEYEEYKNYNQSWHLAIWRAAGNKKIEAILSSLWNGLSMGNKTSEKEYAAISMKEHAKIMHAISNRNSEQARILMRAHIERSMNSILTNVPDPYKNKKK